MYEHSGFEITTMRKAVQRSFLILLFLVGLIYVLLPGVPTVYQFPAIPNSVKSNLDGDTWQNENIIAYFSDFRREEITNFYRSYFSRSLIGIPLPVISLNRPPEEAYKYVRDQQESTFLEEFVFPLRESIFVNGYEPEIHNKMLGRKQEFIGNHILYNKEYYATKTTLRYYPSDVISRLIVYISIWLSGFWLYQLFKVSLKEND